MFSIELDTLNPPIKKIEINSEHFPERRLMAIPWTTSKGEFVAFGSTSHSQLVVAECDDVEQFAEALLDLVEQVRERKKS